MYGIPCGRRGLRAISIGILLARRAFTSFWLWGGISVSSVA